VVDGLAVVLSLATLFSRSENNRTISAAGGHNTIISAEHDNATTSGSDDASTQPFGVRGKTKRIKDDFRQILFPGMTLINQPQGYTNQLIRFSPDDRFAAFLSISDRTCQIIVVDQNAGTQKRVPPPDEKILEKRSIQDFRWGTVGHSLYVMEDATTGARTNAQREALEGNQRVQDLKKRYNVLYRWDVGQTRTKVLDTFPGEFPSIAVAGGVVRVATQAKQKGWGVVEVREYESGKVQGVKTFHVAHNGHTIDCYLPKLLSTRNELWFTTLINPMTPQEKMWLAVMRLDEPNPEAKLIAADVGRFAWTPDENRVIVETVEKSGQHKGQLTFYALQRNALDKPVLLAANHYGAKDCAPQFAGFSPDSSSMYLLALAKPEIGWRDELFEPGMFQLYKFALPK
jgi:hypothetical protein